MKKAISFSTQGQRADIGSQVIYRMLPNRYAEAVGPFVFLDYIPLAVRAANDPVKKRGTHPHPHRGIATLTYVLSGEAEHYDSRGNHAKVYSGGVQWMKSGTGIIHEESFGSDPQDRTTHGFQFWINLPSKNKAESPEYLALQAVDIPQRMLADDAGWLKVIVGEYEELTSRIPNYSKQFLYHIHLGPHKQFMISAETGIEYAAFTVGPHIVLNDTEHEAAEFVELDREAGTIELVNNSDTPNDVLLFGGERYTEPIVADGPFVMNTHAEIAQAYLDLHEGKYGTITKADK
jgi:redox-sensitive bicupin YhaK (pirin superfamily)